MRLFIAGSQKTGNVWLERLLSLTYDIPAIDLALISEVPPPIEEDSYVTHQHYLPSADFLAWGKQQRVRFITITRHPADVFVSLYHYVNRFAELWSTSGWLGVNRAHVMIGRDIDDPEVLRFLADDFRSYIVRSLAWLRSGESLIVRYEDLKTDPRRELKQLTDQIRPVADHLIEQAVEASHFDKMRRESRLLELHCRRGKAGGWHDELGPRHVEIFRRSFERELELLDYDLGDGTELSSHPRAEAALFAIESSSAPARETRKQLERLEEAIAQRDEEVARVDALLEACSRELGYRRRSLEHVTQHADSLDDVVISLETERNAIKTVLDSRDVEVTNAKELLHGRDSELEAATKLLDAKDSEIAALESVVGARDRELETLKALLRDRESEIANALKLLGDRKAELEASQQMLKDRISEIGSIGQILEGRNDEVSALNEFVQGKREEITSLNKLLEGRNDELKALKGVVASRDREIDSLRQVVETREREVTSVNTILASRDGEVATLGGFVEDREKERDSLRSVLESRDEEIESFKALVKARDEELASARTIIEARDHELRLVTDVLQARDEELTSLRAVAESQKAELRSLVTLVELSEGHDSSAQESPDQAPLVEPDNEPR